jgi:guanosine-3',5'-bis(diphosphate) 3'-pyrophosphohydrolase
MQHDIPLADRQLWQRAVSFAARCHHGQMRKDAITPYVAHPFRVALTVRQVFAVDDPMALCVALLHDVIEDTTTDYDEVQAEFGDDIAQAVARLTKDKRLPEEERERRFYEQIDEGGWIVRLVKLADAYDNLSDRWPGQRALTKTLDRAGRALRLRRDDPRLQAAAERLEALVREVADENPPSDE